MQTIYDMCETAGSDEPNTVRLVVSPKMTPEDVVNRILDIQQDQSTADL